MNILKNGHLISQHLAVTRELVTRYQREEIALSMVYYQLVRKKIRFPT